MGILVYLPGYSGDGGDKGADLVTRGLGGFLETGIAHLPTPVVKGPDGGSGTLFTSYPGGDPREYNGEAQTWMEAPPEANLPKGRYWLGYVTAQKPGPADLQRRDLIDGESVLLSDGNTWIVPCCEYAPKRLTRDTNSGQEMRVVMDEHCHWVEWSNAIYRLFVSDEFQAAVAKDRVVNIPHGLSYAALCLSKNYRVNADAIDLLGLIGEYEAFDIARVATGMSTIERLVAQKKSEDSPSLQPSPN